MAFIREKIGVQTMMEVIISILMAALLLAGAILLIGVIVRIIDFIGNGMSFVFLTIIILSMIIYKAQLYKWVLP